MRTLSIFSLALIVTMSGCGIGDISIDISPKSTTVRANSDFQFSAEVGRAGNKTVLWTATGGTVTATGLFTAPDQSGTFRVTATSQADPSKTDSATVTVISPVVISPSSATVSPGGLPLTFSAVVTATGDTQVTWSILEGAAGGSIDATGVYTPPATAGTIHVVATSVADPTLSGVAIVRVGV